MTSPVKPRLRVPVPTTADAGIERVWRRTPPPNGQWNVYMTYRFAGHRFLGHGRVDAPTTTDRDEIRDAEARADAAALRQIRDEVGRHNHQVKP